MVGRRLLQILDLFDISTQKSLRVGKVEDTCEL